MRYQIYLGRRKNGREKISEVVGKHNLIGVRKIGPTHGDFIARAVLYPIACYVIVALITLIFKL